MLSDDPNKPPPPPTPSRRFPSADGSSILSCSKRRLSDDSHDSTHSSKVGRETPFKKQKKSSFHCNPPIPPPSVARKKTRSTSANGDDCQNVKVVARVRPLSDKENKEQSLETIVCSPESSFLTIDGNRRFEYDAVFAPNATQREVYEKTAGDTVHRNILRGFNTTILAYGQTGSGKTFTMGTEGGNANASDDGAQCREGDLVPPADGDGIIPRAVYDVFRTQKDLCNQEVKVELSYLEIYNEEIRDLLSAENEKDTSVDLAIRDRADGGVSVTGLTSALVRSPAEVCQLMESAALRRATASTAMNAVSSRSHAICTLNVTISPSSQENEEPNDSTENMESSGEQICAKLTLVDLAGSERIKRTGAEGARMKEGISINKGLFVLGQVVSALSEMGQQSEQSVSTHIPYRDSKLTRLLQDSLGGNSRTVMVACVSPADTNTEESLNTLRYAQRTRNIKNSARRNVVAAPLSAAEAAALRRENQMLKLQLSQARAKSSASSTAQSLGIPSSLTSSMHASTSAADAHSFVHGLNVEKLEIVTRLRASCKTLQTKVEKLEEQVQSSVEDALSASLRADRSQLKHEEVVAAAKAAGITLSDKHDLKDKLDIVSAHRKELTELKNQMLETQADAAMARATAAAIVAGGGDLMSAEVILESEDFDELNGGGKGARNSDLDRRQQDELASELVAMSGEIEQKEAMARQMNQERECMEEMQSHFEAALHSLQQEVQTLSVERSDLLSKLDAKKNSSKNGKSVPKNSDAEKTKMQARISELEKRIKELNRKASEHTRAIRMKDAAERKCVQLAAEIVQDKKTRAALQRKMKEEAEERRSEKKAARLQAARMLRDSQKLQYELNKVKDAAAKQATVLKRKMDAMLKQQNIEGKRKRPTSAIQSNRSIGSYTSTKSVSSKMSRGDASTGAKRDDLENWLDGEIESGALVKDAHLQIEEQTGRLSEAFAAKEDILSKMDAGDNSSSAPAALRSIESEIDSRTKVLQQLQRSLSDIQQAAQKLSANTEKIPPSLSFAGFVDIATWLGLSRSELRIVSGCALNRLISFKLEVNRIKTRHEDAIASAVNAAVSKERRGTDEAISRLKMEHAEAIMTLLESTKGAIEQKLSHRIMEAAEGGIDQSVRCAVDDMLGSYLKDCTKVGSEVREELLDVKHKQEGMKRVVDQVAEDIISKNESAAIVKPKKTKKRVKQNHDTESDYDEFELEDDIGEDDLIEDSDSDWSPDTPAPKKRRPPKREKMDPDTSIEDSTEGETNESGLGALTVSRLREMLRTRGLPVSGKKKDLVVRLKEAMSASPGGDSDQSKENHHPVSSTPSKTPSKRRAPRQPLANKNIEDPSNNHVMDETIVFSAKKKKRVNEVQLSRGALRRKNMADALSKALSDAENMV